MKALAEAAFQTEWQEVRCHDGMVAIGIPGAPFSAVPDHAFPLADADAALAYAAQSNGKVLLEIAP